MFNIFITYFIIVVYLFFGYLIYNWSIIEICKDRHYGKLYEALTPNSKNLLLCIMMVMWLPLLIGEIICAIVKWIANYYID